MDTSVRDPLVGRLLDGRYHVVARVARGGMATVYHAVDRRLERDVALKVMHPHLGEDPEFVARFVREARSAARLSHANVVQVFDQGADVDHETGDVLYLAMELLHGRTLRDVLHDQGALTPREALTVIEHVLSALAAAHQAGIVHRDIKPENVILTDDGRVKVADFGLARALTSAPTQTGALMGTVAYLPPELVAHGVSDTRGDVYAAGVMLFEMLTGRQPFAGDVPVQVAYRHVHETVPAPSTLVPHLPTELDDLVAAAVAKDPDERATDGAQWLRSVRAVHAELTADVLDHRPEVAAAPRTANGSGPLPGEATQLVGPAGPDRTDAHGLPPHPVGSPLPGAEAPSHPTRSLPELSGLRSIRERTRREAREAGRREPAAAAPGPDDDEYAEIAAQRRRRGLTGLAVLLALTAALSVAGWYLVAGPGRFTKTPDVMARSETDARSLLSSTGLVMQVGDGEYSDTVAKGLIARTDPEPGRRVVKQGTVTVHLSLGSARRTVPNLVGKTVEDAGGILEDLGLRVGRTTEAYSDSVAAGKVIATSPGRGSVRKVGDGVALTVSKGGEPVQVPRIIDYWQADAERVLTEAGFRVQVRTGQTDAVQPGRVFDQQPQGEGSAPRGSTVVITVRESTQVQLPDVVNQRVKDAREQLEDLGLQVQVNEIAGAPFRQVRGQDPPAGSTVERGSTVTLNVF